MTAPTRSRRAATPVPHRAASTLLALVVPVALLAAAVVVALAWRDRLPDPVASHWGRDGVDGTSSFGALLAVVPALGLPAAIGGWALAFGAGRSATVRRAGVAVAVWTSAFTAGIVVVVLRAQLDVATAAQARDLDAELAVVFLAPVVVAVLAAWAMPGDPRRPTTEPVPGSSPRLDLAPGAQASWVRRVEWVSPVVLLPALGAFAALMGVATRSWWLAAALLVFLVVLVGGLTGWTVAIDERGLVARSRLPRPRVVVPLDEVVRADVVTVHPLREFGGWGLRLDLHGREGVVLRAGEAIEVTRAGGRRLVITVDDAATGAALLNTLAARTRA